MLEARGVVKAFRGLRALKGVSFQVRQGEILGLLGPNGSGKSTFINVASGHFPVTQGSIVFNGRELASAPAHRIARGGISRTYQIPRPFAHLTVLENVALPAMFGAQAVDRRQAEQDAWRWLEFTGLSGRAHALPEDLNLHQRKFLEFARALAARPKLLMLDEVLSGLTPAEIDEAVALIQRIRAQGTTILFVEHVMRAVMALCDRVVIFDQGNVLAEGLPAEVMSRPEVVSAYLGKPMEGSHAGPTPGEPGHA
jgi:branched-chain amino acid transport system permease protein